MIDRLASLHPFYHLDMNKIVLLVCDVNKSSLVTLCRHDDYNNNSDDDDGDDDVYTELYVKYRFETL